MRSRFLAFSGALAVNMVYPLAWVYPLAGVCPLAGQTASRAVPRTSDGHPDLQGVWTNVTLTPLERPKELANKPYFTKEEAAEYEERMLQRRAETGPVAGDSVNDPIVWWERGTRLVRTLRTSL